MPELEYPLFLPLQYAVFTDALVSLDDKIGKLSKLVEIADETKLNYLWKREFRKFVLRWEAFRDSRATWISRVIAIGGIIKLSKFEYHFTYWAGDFERRTQQLIPLNTPVKRPNGSIVKEIAEEAGNAISSAIPSEVWWILAGGVAIYAISRKD